MKKRNFFLLVAFLLFASLGCITIDVSIPPSGEYSFQQEGETTVGDLKSTVEPEEESAEDTPAPINTPAPTPTSVPAESEDVKFLIYDEAGIF